MIRGIAVATIDVSGADRRTPIPQVQKRSGAWSCRAEAVDEGVCSNKAARARLCCRVAGCRADGRVHARTERGLQREPRTDRVADAERGRPAEFLAVALGCAGRRLP